MRPKLVHVTTLDVSLVFLLRSQLERFAEQGFEVFGVSSPGGFGEALARGGIWHVPIASLAPGGGREDGLRAAGELVRLFRRERPALVHTHDRDSSAIVRLAARLGHVPAIVDTVHGQPEEPVLATGKRPRRSDRAVMRLGHHVLFESHSDHRWALRGRTVLPARSSWLGTGVDVHRFDPARVDHTDVVEMRRRWRLGVEDRVVGTLTAPGTTPHAAQVKAAMLRVAGSATPVIVSITADGANQPARAEGPLVCAEASVEELPAVHSAFDVFAFPTAGAGLSRWALEASAMKRPVLAADDMAGEVVESGNTGWVEPPADVEALAKVVGDLLDDPGHAAAMGASGRARVLERFDEDAVVERSLQVYRRLLRRRGIRWDGERAEV